MAKQEINRCGWPLTDPLLIEYHDLEWGVPVHDDSLHYEYLVLDAAQAGLSWRTVLYKRENYRKAFHKFDYHRIARYGAKDVDRLLANVGIIRNRQKIMSAIGNARCFLRVQEEFGSFDKYVWRFVNGKSIRNRWKSLNELPAKTSESEAMSRDLAGRGFKFVGPTICYAYMQAAGLVNDHTVDCFRHKQL
ncbi:DNA-3-methyladenine glycosylase I [candidate division KSB1 bacterium]|nr:DNA-3-methyladenine glycosylase I [candidate division KSB1 bacterium]